MRAGVLISAVSHIVLVAFALLGTPKLFDAAAPSAIEVDLVRPDEVEPPKEKLADKPAEWNPLAEKTEPWPEAASQAQPKQPDVSQQAALGPQIPSPTPAQPPKASPWIFDPVNIPALLDLPNAPEKGFDAES